MRDNRSELFNMLLLILKNNIEPYRNGKLYQQGKNQELDDVVRKSYEFSRSYDQYCAKYPAEREKLTMFLMVDYAVKHHMIDG